MKKYLSVISTYLLLLLFSTCKKYDPDCATCPCPACPIITEVIPNHGRPGDTLILKGDNFKKQFELNIIQISNIKVEEIIEGTKNQLKIIVPNISSSGQVKIKIDDEKALSSDEIPDYKAPYFRLDHFVELFAGTPQESGNENGEPSTASFRTISDAIYDDDNNCVICIDKTSSNLKLLRQIDSTGTVTTKYTTANSGINLSSISKSYQGYSYFIETTNGSSTSYIKKFLVNGVLWYPSPQFSTSLPKRYTSPLYLDQSNSVLYYGSESNYLQTSNHIKIRSINLNDRVNDSLFSFLAGTTKGITRFLIFNGEYYYLKFDISNQSAINSQLFKRKHDDISIEITLSGLLQNVISFAIDKKGNIYFSRLNQIFKLMADGSEELVAGQATMGYNSEPTLPLDSQFSVISNLFFDKDNNLYIVDAGNFCIRRLKIE